MAEVSTLLVVPKTEKCNAGCKFCVTKAINELENHEKMEEKGIYLPKLHAVAKFSKQIGVVDTNITGGTEPTLEEPRKLNDIVATLASYFGRVNMYTNGAKILDDVDYGNFATTNLLSMLSTNGLTNLTISRAHYDDARNSEAMGLKSYDLEKIAEKCDQLGVDLKLSCLLLKDYVGNEGQILKYIGKAKELGIGKVIFRELLDLSGADGWIRRNYVSVKKAENLMEKLGAKESRGLWDQKIWDYKGIAVTAWPDGSRKDTVNNGDLIYMPDNHLYSSWITKASRIM
jgi:molybdenum cofactor biosynthesis enzyme MoaA